MIFVHFFLLEAFFANLETYSPSQSGRSVLLVIDVFVITLAVIGVIIIAIYENYTGRMAKIATYLVLYSNCIYLFYWQSNYERQLFTRPDRFDTSSIVIILVYFVCELIFTFHIINKLYKSE